MGNIVKKIACKELALVRERVTLLLDAYEDRRTQILDGVRFDGTLEYRYDNGKRRGLYFKPDGTKEGIRLFFKELSLVGRAAKTLEGEAIQSILLISKTHPVTRRKGINGNGRRREEVYGLSQRYSQPRDTFPERVDCIQML